jgi:hypothetical protein
MVCNAIEFKDSPTFRRDTLPPTSWLKRQAVSELHGVSIQAPVFLTVIALKASNPIR